MATGMNPGKTGVYDFNNRSDFSYSVHAVNSGYFKGRSMWDILSDRGFKVGVFYYPMLYPAYPVNGRMISGFGGFYDRKAFYPNELRKEIFDGFKDPDLMVGFEREEYDDLELFWADVKETWNRLMRIFSSLLEEDYDVYYMVISLTDCVQHRAWPLIESFIGSGSGDSGEEVSGFWRGLDSGLEELLDKHTGKHDIIMVSDHGFGRQDLTFNLSRWLIESGFSKEKKIKESGLLDRSWKRAKRTAMEHRFLRKHARRLRSTSLAKRLEGSLDSMDSGIDLESSRAYTLDHTTPFGAIYLNLSGREKWGFLSEREYGEMRQRIRSGLCEFFDESGSAVEVYFPEDIYSGPFLSLAPDVIFQIDGGRGVAVRRRQGSVLENKPFSERHLGSHRMKGVFLAHGPSFNPGCEGIGELSIYDIMPLCSMVMGVAPEMGVDGRIRQELLSRELWESRKGLVATLKEKERINKRIRDLGDRL
jgi:predicted AlkP superfamily phosphohydrolase/phosphomutase